MKVIFYKLLIINILVLISGLLIAQPQANITAMVVKGVVIDEASNEPMIYTTVALYRTSDSSLVTGVVTNDLGIFVLETTPGTYYLSIDFIGYAKKTVDNITVNRANPMTDLGTIMLETSSVSLAEIEVRAEKSTMQFNLDKKVFNVGKDLANQGGSASDILDNVPSVTVDVEGNVSLRGQGNVRILVDGKPSSLVGSDGSGLKNIPASMIDRIEVVTNPSARYDAEGMTGIINIVLKKDKKKGFNGSFDVNAGFPANYGTALNVNYRRNKLNFFVNYGINYRKGPGGGSLYQELYQGDSTIILDMEREHTRGGWSNNVRTGIDFFATEKVTLTGALSYRTGIDKNETTLTYRDYINTTENLIGYSDRVDNEDENESKLEYSVNFKKTFDKKEQLWTADIQYSNSSEIEKSNITETFYGSNGQLSKSELEQRSTNNENFKNLLVQTDYILPFKEKGKLEMGVRFNLRNVDNDILVEEYDATEWTNLTNLSNNLRYKENIYAAYGMIGDKFGKFSYQAGLRYEYSDIETYLVQTDTRNPREYGNFFPSAVLNYEFSEKDAIQMSYSRRIRRPGFWELNPFYSFSDARNFFAGNPNVNPEFTNAYEISYLKFFEKGSLSTAAYYRHTDDVISRIRTVDSTGFGITLPQNIGFSDAYGLEVNFSYNPFKWWRISGDGNFYRIITDGTSYNEGLYSDTYTWFGRITSRMTIYKSVDLQIRGNYRAGEQTPQGSQKARYHFDVAASRDIFKKNGTLTLSISDVFNTRRWNYEVFGDNFSTIGDFQWRVRQITLALNYRLNQEQRRGGGRPSGGGFEGGGGGF
jgi:outer membrane receptor protein involved in Fe transport